MQQKKYFVIELLTVFALIAEIIAIGLFIELYVGGHVSKGLVLVVILWILLWAIPFIIAYKEHMGKDELLPNEIYVKDLRAYFEKLAAYFADEEAVSEIISKNEEYEASYILAKKRGTVFRILFVNIAKFDKKEYEKIKQRANRYINKKNDISQENKLGTSHMRVNVIITTCENQKCEEIVSRNAENLFSRVETVLNVVAYKDENVIKVPSHFGLSRFNEYMKIWGILQKCTRC